MYVRLEMKTQEEVLKYGLSLPGTYQDAPFRDPNWQLVRVRKNKKAFLWTYERNGAMCINVKINPEWRDLWRDMYPSVLPGYHQNKEQCILGRRISENEYFFRFISFIC